MIRVLFSRIGCLMGLAGGIVLPLGAAVYQSGEPAWDFLLQGAALFVVGFFLWNRLRRRDTRRTRFSLFRRRESRRGQADDDSSPEDRLYD